MAACAQTDYLKQISIPSKIGKVKKPLVVFDLDGTVGVDYVPALLTDVAELNEGLGHTALSSTSSKPRA